ncbi:WD40 repeat domain-containing protein [Caballeronia humi]|uniref:WD40 repeat domain-containing protein n=1 Tax=Caballeronia humi TaxID=326474 RepID=UPI001357A7AE|nr:PD40 domain-containing protein [Caballeronia humi]
MSVSFSPDGRRIVYRGSDYSARLWDAATRKSKLQYASSSQVFSVTFSPDGRYIVSGNSSGTLSLWDGTTVERLRSDLEAHTQSVLSVAFTPDSSRILSGSEDRTLRLWDVATGQPIGPPRKGSLRLWPAPSSWAYELCAKLSRNMSRQQWREWASPEIEYKCQ